MAFIIDDLCVFIGVFTLWILRGFKYNIWTELNKVKPLDFFRRGEGLLGLFVLSTVAIIVKLSSPSFPPTHGSQFYTTPNPVSNDTQQNDTEQKTPIAK